jgi:EAL domain-containing protein (putative c-di-GMP-specific phosphodiesterase class I)
MTPAHLSTVFQPVVDLTTGSPVAYEALTRGTHEGRQISPDQLFEDARAADRVADFDHRCWGTSLRSAQANALTRPYSVLVNVEPESLRAGRSTHPLPPTPLVIELTERALLSDPGALLQHLDHVRAQGHAIAIDDLGADPASLALIPIIDPDVVKLDMRLIQARPDAEIALIMSAVNRHASARDLVVIAEGIETADQLVTARALGATHGQGWFYGHPAADVPDAHDLAGLPIRRPSSPAVEGGTPFEIVAGQLEAKSSERELLLQMSLFLEARASASGDSAVVLTTFRDATDITPTAARRYLDLGQSCALVMVHTHGTTEVFEDTPVHVNQLVEDDPLLLEWDVVVLTADFSAVLAARARAASGHDEGTYDFILSHDRTLAAAAARNLILRGQH